MAKKRNGDPPIDEWDESLNSESSGNKQDPFYAPLGTEQQDDDDWGFSTETQTHPARRRPSKERKGQSAGSSSGLISKIVSIAAAVILLVGAAAVIGTNSAASTWLRNLFATPVPTTSAEITIPDTTQDQTPVFTPAKTADPTPQLTTEPTPEPTPEQTAEPTPEQTPEPSPEPTSAFAENVWYGQELRYYYQQLTPHEKQVFEQLYNGLLGFEKNISISPCSEDEFNRVWFVIYSDTPELFHFNGGGKMWGYGQITEYEAEYRIDQATYQATSAHIYQIVDELRTGLPALAGDYEKEKAVHYWLTDHCEYLAAGDDSTALADACLYYGRSQCSGYAKANSLLLRMMGINCLDVTSDTHEWNIVRINSRWYQCDATWDDLDYPWKTGGNRVANWFNVPDRLVNDPDHKIDVQPGFVVPACDSLQDNYCYREGIYVQGGQANPAGYIADSLEKTKKAGKYSVSILVDDVNACKDWDHIQNKLWDQYGVYDWVLYPPQDTQTVFAVYNPQ